MQFSTLSPQIRKFFDEFFRKLGELTLEESIRYIRSKEREIHNCLLILESQQEQIKIRWMSQNNEPRREEYLQADLENLNEQYKHIILSNPSLDKFMEAMSIICAV